MSDNDQDRGEGKSPETQKVTPPDELEGKVTPPDELEGNYFFKTEFDIRNREILDNSDKIYRIIQIVFTFVPTFLAGVLALGKRDGERSWWFVPITSERSWWFVPITSLLVFAIIIPSVLLVTSSLRSTVRASQYLRLRYFSSGRLKGWEHYIQFFRANAQTTKYRFFANSLTWIFAGLSLLTIVVSLTSVGVNISQAKKDLAWLLIYILILLICVILSIVSIQNLKKSWSSKAFAKCYNDWLLIDKDIKKGITLEQIPAGEDEAIAKLIDVERQLLQRKIDHDKLPAPKRPVPRGQHPKHHGCVQAWFVIADDLSEALKFGLFHQEGKRFPAYIRFSNARVQDDQHPGGHAMAIKLMGVSGDKLLPGEEHAETHDFLLLDSPVFFIKNAIEFASFDAALLAREKSWLGLLSLAGYFATHIWEALILLKRIASKISTNPLETKYWSATPYKLGDGAVKYFARPRRHGPPNAAKTPSVDQPRHAMKRTLDTRDATFDFFIQRQVDPVNTPIEDATHNWDESVSSYEKVATIHIPRQKFDCDAQMEFCQNLAYNPWHALSDHRPLGGINRARKAVYVALSAMRHKLNNVSYQEPNPETVPTE